MMRTMPHPAQSSGRAILHAPGRLHFGAVRLLAIAGLAAIVPGAARAGDGYNDIYNFSGYADGNAPRGDLLSDGHGGFYGTTATGGDTGDGVVFDFVPPRSGSGSGTTTRIWSFTAASNGSLPSAGLVADASGALYGTTSRDGAGYGGTVFQLIPPAQGQTGWTEATLWSFGTGAGGNTPVGTLSLDQSGALYGTTTFGGSGGKGVVFQLVPPGPGQTGWTENVLWNFPRGTHGGQPVGGLMFDQTGALYGTTKAGGSAGLGTVFELAPPTGGVGQWTQTTLYAFQGGADGSGPQGSLMFDASGALYGTTTYGGTGDTSGNCVQVRFPYYGAPNSRSDYAKAAPYIPVGGNGCGVVFKLTRPRSGTLWTETSLYQFTGGGDGANPLGRLIMDQNGAIYGLASEMGHQFWGTIFQLAPPKMQGGVWTETTLASMVNKLGGFYPHGGLTYGALGRLYATMPVGGKTWEHVAVYGYGTVVNVKP
jgi:uncharacterized repeat protein (TIGR03803 family)